MAQILCSFVCINISQYVVMFLLPFQVTEVENDVMSPEPEEEGSNAVSQLARKVH